MNEPLTFILASLFLLAIPLNVYVAREVRHEADERPRIATLTLLSRLVTVLAIVAITLGVTSFTSVLFLATGVRVIPMPGTTIALIVVLLLASFANVFVLRYLRQMRRPT